MADHQKVPKTEATEEGNPGTKLLDMTSHKANSHIGGSENRHGAIDNQALHAVMADIQRVRLEEATSKVWNISELMEQILRHLPAADLLAVSEVNVIFYNCIANSLVLRERMFLRTTSQKQFERYKGCYITGVHQRRLQPIELCPFFELWDHGRTFKDEPLWRMSMQENTEYAKFTRQPAKLRMLADMLLTDPPVMEAYVYLYYTHSSNPSIVISVRRVVRHTSPLTLGLLVHCARRALGDVWMVEQVQGTRGPCLFARHKANTCIKTEAEKQIQRLGGQFNLDLKASSIGFEGCVVPSTLQRKTMEEKR